MIGEKLKTLRKNRNLKQDDIAELFGITKGTVSNWENNRRTPNIQQLQRLSDFYGVSMDYFNEEEKKPVKIEVEVKEVIYKAKNLLNDENVSLDDKERLFNEIMRLYVDIKNK